MRTMVQDELCDYDIDDEIYFNKEDLKDGDDSYLGAQDQNGDNTGTIHICWSSLIFMRIGV
ncbi:hypothetical protein EC847_1491 [Scandinavium goeteborgense]|uniref:Uncharacterized protein n=2 Tax=Scandinavium goeteborgense TaxID=1851514 RepID=A0A4R6DMB5_SCAGO|nr:hypothetical protein EC847_1491 [Scandinavium goeteborgense]